MHNVGHTRTARVRHWAVTRDALFWVALTLVSFVLPAVASANVAAVPHRVQRQIARLHPRLAFVPTLLPPGYHYAKWIAGRGGFDISFDNPERTPNDLGYDVVKADCAAAGQAMKTFRMNGVNVSWSATYEDQQAWRCLKVGHTTLVLTASRSVAGDDALNTPSRRRDALDLVRLVAYVRRAS